MKAACVVVGLLLAAATVHAQDAVTDGAAEPTGAADGTAAAEGESMPRASTSAAGEAPMPHVSTPAPGDEPMPNSASKAGEKPMPNAAAPAAGEEPMPRVATSAAAGRSGAMDRLVLERTEITGNRELPKVLYIVPWRKPDPGALMGRPVNTLLDEVLAPLDREEFVRQVDYYSDLYGDDGPRAMRAPAAPDSTSGQDTGARAAGD